MADDLLVQLLDSWISKGNAPDRLSMEFRGEPERASPVICFYWIDANIREEYPYTEKRYREVWYKFEDYLGPYDIAG